MQPVSSQAQAQGLLPSTPPATPAQLQAQFVEELIYKRITYQQLSRFTSPELVEIGVQLQADPRFHTEQVAPLADAFSVRLNRDTQLCPLEHLPTGAIVQAIVLFAPYFRGLYIENSLEQELFHRKPDGTTRFNELSAEQLVTVVEKFGVPEAGGQYSENFLATLLTRLMQLDANLQPYIQTIKPEHSLALIAMIASTERGKSRENSQSQQLLSLVVETWKNLDFHEFTLRQLAYTVILAEVENTRVPEMFLSAYQALVGKSLRFQELDEPLVAEVLACLARNNLHDSPLFSLFRERYLEGQPRPRLFRTLCHTVMAFYSQRNTGPIFERILSEFVQPEHSMRHGTTLTIIGWGDDCPIECMRLFCDGIYLLSNLPNTENNLRFFAAVEPFLLRKMDFLETADVECLVMVMIACTTKHCLSSALSSFIEPLVLERLDQMDDVALPALNTLRFLHYASATGFIAAVKKLIDKKVNSNARDTFGNTALHYALRNNRAGIVELLLSLPDIDPTCLNYSNQTAFRKAMESSGFHTLVNYFLPFMNRSQLQVLSQENGRNFLEYCITHPECLFGREMNPLYLPFYLQDFPLAQAVASKMAPEEFTKAVSLIKKRFPSAPMELIEMAPFQLNSEHMSQEVGVVIPPKPADAKVDDLLIMCQDLQVDTTSQGILKKDLIDKINEKRVYIGTPQANSPALTTFYQQIENAVCHVIAKLNSLEKTPAASERKWQVLRAFVQVAPFCGGAIQRAAIDQYDMVVRGKTLTFEKSLFEAIGDHRKMLFDTLVPPGDQNIHDFLQLFFLLAKELNLPYANTAYDDTAASLTPPDKEKAKQRFSALYTPVSIFSFVALKLQQDADFRNQYIDWWKNHIPVEWKADQYEAVRLEVGCLISQGGSQEDVAKLLQGHLIAMQGNGPEEAINEDRASAYLQECVYDENFALTRDAMVQMLISCGIILK